MSEEPQNDLDREKVRMFWDYHKTRTYTSLTLMISLLVGAIVILNAINLAGRVPVQAVLIVTWFVMVIYFPIFLIKGVLIKNKKLVIETDALMQKLAKHEPLPPLKELLKVEEPSTLWIEYKKLFGLSKNQIFLLTVLLIALLVLGLLGI